MCPRPIPNPDAAARYAGPSKTQVKKDMLELQELGLALGELPTVQFNALDLDQPLRDALVELKRLRNFSARKRQGQFIGKLLRGRDVAPLQRALAARRK